MSHFRLLITIYRFLFLATKAADKSTTSSFKIRSCRERRVVTKLEQEYGGVMTQFNSVSIKTCQAQTMRYESHLILAHQVSSSCLFGFKTVYVDINKKGKNEDLFSFSKSLENYLAIALAIYRLTLFWFNGHKPSPHKTELTFSYSL